MTSPRSGRTVAVVIVAFVLLTVGLGTLTIFRRAGDDEAQYRRIAVRPFGSLTGVATPDLERATTEGVIARLRTIPGVEVTLLPAVTPSPASLAGFDVLLEGSVARKGSRLGVFARLTRVADGKLLWSETFDERSGDLTAVQIAVAERASFALGKRLPSPDSQNER